MSGLTFGIGPVHLDEEGAELRELLGQRLSAVLGVSVRVVATRSYAELVGIVERREVELAWMPPAVFVRTEPSGLHLLAAVERARGAGYRGALFVPHDSSAQTVADLKGKCVAWVDRDSCAGHLFIRRALRAQKIEPSELFGDEKFVGSYGAVVRAVMRDEADAGATHVQVEGDELKIVLAGWQTRAGKDGMRTLLVTDPIPPDVVCASDRLGADLVDDVRQALFTLHKADASELVDEFFGGVRLIGVPTVNYDPVREAMR